MNQVVYFLSYSPNILHPIVFNPTVAALPVVYHPDWCSEKAVACIPEVPGSKLGRDSGNPDGIFLGFPICPSYEEWYIGQATSTSKSLPIDEIPTASYFKRQQHCWCSVFYYKSFCPQLGLYAVCFLRVP